MVQRLSALCAVRISLERFLLHISVRDWVDPKAIVRLEELGESKPVNGLIGIWNSDLSACSIAPQSTTVHKFTKNVTFVGFEIVTAVVAADILIGLLNPEDGGYIFLWNISWLSTDYKALKHTKKNSMVWVRQRTIPPGGPTLSAKWLPTFADRVCHVVSVTDPYGRILGFLDRSRYFSITYLLSCTHEAGWTPFQTHYFFLSGSAGNRTRASGSVAKNFDH
jgi:hypothetical protein